MKSLFLTALAAAIVFITPATPSLAADPAKPGAVVHFSKLTPFLVDEAGWEAEKARGETVDAAGFKMTSAERNYNRDDKSVRVQILDYSESAPMLEGITAGWAFSRETSEGYQKVVTIEGCKGMEQYENADKRGEVFLLVGGRFLLQMETTGLPPEELRAWVKKIDLKKLSALK